MAQLDLPGAAIAFAAALAIAATTMSARQAKPAYPGTLDDHPAIQYASTAPNDPVQRLADELASGKRTLARQEPSGYLQSVLEALNLPAESQVRVLSKTGIQKDFTSPANPRQFFFNESTYVGYIPGAPLLELASHDPQQGMQFYIINQGAATATITRTRMCISCHLAASTLFVPGIIDRSNHIDDNGIPIPQLGFSIVNHTTPHNERWGGWSSATDEIAALMLFNHQSHAINLLTSLAWQWRVAVSDGATTLDGDLRTLANELADYLIFTGEAALPSPVKPRAGFAEQLVRRFPRDSKGRSLAEMDLNTRLLKYRCSYMVYTPAFDALPRLIKDAVYTRIADKLSGQPALEILRETKVDFRELRSR